MSWYYTETIDGVTPTNSVRGHIMKNGSALYGTFSNAVGSVVYFVGYNSSGWHVYDLSSKITTQTVSGQNVLTNVPSTITITTDRTYLKKCVNVVDLLIFFKPTASGTITVGNLPSSYYPAYNLYLSPVNNSEDKPEGNCIITSGGVVNVYGVTANKEYVIHITYII